MTNEEKLRHCAERMNLQDQDVDYILGLLRDAKAEAYEEAAQATLAREYDERGDYDEGYSDALHDAAADIRALKDSPQWGKGMADVLPLQDELNKAKMLS